MPQYQVYFKTVPESKPFKTDIDDHESIEVVINDLLAELQERGYAMEGEAEGVLRVTWTDKTLDLSAPLPEQGVRPNEVLKVGYVVLNG